MPDSTNQKYVFAKLGQSGDKKKVTVRAPSGDKKQRDWIKDVSETDFHKLPSARLFDPVHFTQTVTSEQLQRRSERDEAWIL